MVLTTRLTAVPSSCDVLITVESGSMLRLCDGATRQLHHPVSSFLLLLQLPDLISCNLVVFNGIVQMLGLRNNFPENRCLCGF